MSESKRNELATISIYLNTPIIATILGVGFLFGAILFAGLFLVLN